MFSKITAGIALFASSPAFGETPSFQGLGDLPGSYYRSVANGVSDDGSVIVGESDSELGTEAFRWTVSDGMIRLGDRPGGGSYSQAWDVSGNGSVIVGGGGAPWSGGREGFCWDQGVITDLGDLPGGGTWSDAYGVSADGSVVVGIGLSDSAYEALRWDGDGMTGLGDLPAGSFWSEARSV